MDSREVLSSTLPTSWWTPAGDYAHRCLWEHQDTCQPWPFPHREHELCSVSKQAQPSRDWGCSCEAVSWCSFLNAFLGPSSWWPFNRTWKCWWPDGADACHIPGFPQTPLSTTYHRKVRGSPGGFCCSIFSSCSPFNPRLNSHQIFATNWLAQRSAVICLCFLVQTGYLYLIW